jgi:hypothetical protein
MMAWVFLEKRWGSMIVLLVFKCVLLLRRGAGNEEVDLLGASIGGEGKE